MKNKAAQNAGLRAKISDLKQRTQRLESILAKLEATGRQLYMDQSFRKCVIERAAEGKLVVVNKMLEERVERRTAILEETNAALRVTLNQREEDKQKLADSIMANLNEMVHPYLAQLSQTPINSKQTTLLEILKANLD